MLRDVAQPQSLVGLGAAVAMVVSLWLSLQRGWLYTRRSYLDLLAATEKLVAITEKLDRAKDERIADLKDSAEMLRKANAEREAQLAILLSARKAEP